MSFKTVKVVHPYPDDSLGKYHDFKLYMVEKNELLIKYQGKYWELEEEKEEERSTKTYFEPTYKVKNYSMPFLYKLQHWALATMTWSIVLLVAWNIIDWIFLGGELSELGAFVVFVIIVFLVGSYNDS